MKRFSFFSLLVLVVLAVAFALHSCQKEIPNSSIDREIGSVGDRANDGNIYGVTLFDGSTPCQVVTMDQFTGTVTNAVNAFVIDNGTSIPLDNLKGICRDNGDAIYLTTGTPVNQGFPSTLDYNDALFRVDPATGECFYISTSKVGTVSDLEFNPISTNFIGLLNNSNATIEISLNIGTGLYDIYSAPAPVSNIAPGFTLKGLSLTRDMYGMHLMGCATSPNTSDPAKQYSFPAFLPAALYETDLLPASELGAGHCGIGFDLDLNSMLINRSNQVPTPTLGLNIFGWGPPFAPTTQTFLWGGFGYNFEDLSSSVY